MTAPVKAILATLTDELVGLRCRPLIKLEIPLVSAREVSCRVRAGEVARPSFVRDDFWLHPKEPVMAFLVCLSADRLGPPPPSSGSWMSLSRWMELGAIGEGGPINVGRTAWQDGNRSPTGRHLGGRPAFPVLKNYERTLKAQGVRAFPQVFSRLKPQVATL